MSDQSKMICEMVDILPAEDQTLAVEFIKKLVLAWDPDYTKVTSYEREKIEHAENSGFIADEDIDWDHLEKYAE